MGRRWFNAAAVEWVLYGAPADLPPGLVLTLAAVASHAGSDGRGAYPAADTIARLARKSDKQARRDIRALADLGLLIPGDRRAAEKHRADRRPNVWDLPAEAREYIGRHRKGMSRLDINGGSPASTREGDDWTSDAPTTGHLRPHDSPPMSTEEFLKNSGKGAPPPPAGGADGDAPETQTPVRLADPGHVADVIAEARASLAAIRGRAVIESSRRTTTP